MQWNGLAEMCAIRATEGGVEHHPVEIGANGRVVFLDPGNPKNDIMGSRGDVESDRFFIAGKAEGEGVIVSDMSTFRGTSISEDEGDGRMFGRTGKLVARG